MAASKAGSAEASRNMGVAGAGILKTSTEDASAIIRNCLENKREFLGACNDF
jgi:hypothetical protein